MKDYNADFGPLHVYDQGATNACFYYATSLMAAAKVKAYTGKEPTWGGQPPGHWAPAGGWATQLSDGEHVVKEGTHLSPTDHTTLRAEIDSCGVLAAAVEMPDSIRVFHQPALPVLHVNASDAHTSAHSLLVVGYTDDGILAQSSWGTAWGFQGRAVFGWDWWDDFCVGLFRSIVDSYPETGMPTPTRPPVAPVVVPPPAAPTPPTVARSSVTLIRRATGGNVYALTGGVRSWVYSRDILDVQGLSMSDVKDLPVQHPAWRTPLVGTIPPNGDI